MIIKKYSIDDNKTNKTIFETDDMNKLDEFIEYNLESSELLHLYKSDKQFIMYFENYTIYMKL